MFQRINEFPCDMMYLVGDIDDDTVFERLHKINDNRKTV